MSNRRLSGTLGSAYSFIHGVYLMRAVENAAAACSRKLSHIARCLQANAIWPGVLPRSLHFSHSSALRANDLIVHSISN